MRCWTFALCLAGMTAFLAPAGSQPGDMPEEPPAPEGRFTLTLDPGGHTGDVSGLGFTRDGRHLVSASADHSIRVWDVETGQTVRVIRPPGSGRIERMVMFHGGKRVAAACWYRDSARGRIDVVYIFSLADGRIVRDIRTDHNTIRALAVSGDGKRLATGGLRDNRVQIWDLTAPAKDKPERVFEAAGPLHGLAFSPDGRRLVEALAEGSHIRDLASGKTTSLKRTRAPLAAEYPVAWSHDGKTLATCGHAGFRLWDADGKLRHHLFRDVVGLGVAFGGDSRTVLLIWREGEKQLHRAAIVDVRTGQEKLVFKPKFRNGAEARYCRCGALSPDGKLAATAGGLDGVHRTFVWNATDGAIVRELVVSPWLVGPRLEAGWSADSKLISWRNQADPAAPWDGRPSSFAVAGLRFGPPLGGEQLRGSVIEWGPISLKPVDGHTVQVLKNGKPLSELKCPREHRLFRMMTLVGEDRAAVAGSGLQVFLYDTTTGKLLHTVLHTGPVKSLAASPDGRFLISLGEDQKLIVCNPRETKPRLLTLYTYGRDWVAWTPEGYYAATPGGERLIGFTVDHGIDRETSFHPVEQFRRVLYRPDVIKLLLEKGSVGQSLAAANAALRKEGVKVTEGAADVEALLPPRVTLTLVDQSKLPEVTLKVEAEAGAKGQLIVALRLLVDGRPLIGKEGIREYREGKQKETVEWKVSLPPGQHQVSALARSADASAVSNDVEIDCRPAAEKPVLHVLAVGVSQYQDRDLNLKSAASDAAAIADAFRKNCKGDIYGEVHATTLPNEKATRPTVLAAIEELRSGPKKAKDNDLVVVFFAGHGATKKNQFYLLTHEANLNDLENTSLSGRALREGLGAFPCQVLLVMDACHAGAFGGTGKLTRRDFKPAGEEVARTMADNEVGVAVLCAAMRYERSEERTGTGLFTKALVEGLSATRDVPYNAVTGRQTVRHLHTFVEDRVSVESGDRQHPFLHMPWTMESFPLRQVRAAGSGQ
jgi:WD40 repeat protein